MLARDRNYDKESMVHKVHNFSLFLYGKKKNLTDLCSKNHSYKLSSGLHI